MRIAASLIAALIGLSVATTSFATDAGAPASSPVTVPNDKTDGPGASRTQKASKPLLKKKKAKKTKKTTAEPAKEAATK